MKKLMTVLSLIFATLLLVSCVEDDDLEDALTGDTTPAGDTVPADQTDTAAPTDPADTGDTNPADPTDPNDPTDPATEPGNDPTNPTSDPTSDPTNPNPGTPCSCGGKECGDDGCGNPCGDYNGGCPDNHTCNISTNLCMCTPSCAGKLCTDDDGCGGTCGCKSNEKCIEETGVCECIPNCEGRQCGDDGCGGTCGGCAEDEVCIESTHTCKGCTTVTLSPVAESVNNNGYIYFRTTSNAYSPNTGDTTQDDKYALTFKSGAATAGSTVDLSTSIEHCDGKSALDNQLLCFYINEDHKVSNDFKRFLPKEGTITVNSINNGSSFTGSGAKINADVSGVKMYEMREYIDNSGIIAKTKYEFVPNGDCIVVEDTTLSYE